MSTPLVSILIPVFNVEQHLRRCLDSVLGQTLTDIQVVVVNDASPDGSEAIIQEYIAKDPRITYIKHSENRGRGGARNTCVANATAQYIGFVDADDWVEPQMFEILYKQAKIQRCDIVSCGYKRHDEAGNYLSDRSFTPQILKGHEPVFALFNGSGSVAHTPWNKIYHRRLFDEHKIVFPERCNFEDYATITKLVGVSERYLVTNEPLYNYIINETSRSMRNRDVAIKSYFDALDSLRSFFIELGLFEEIKTGFYNYFLSQIKFNISTLLITDEKERQAYIFDLITHGMGRINLREVLETIGLETILQMMNFEDVIKQTRELLSIHMQQQEIITKQQQLLENSNVLR